MYSKTAIVYEKQYEVPLSSRTKDNFFYNPFEVATNEKNTNPFYYRVRSCDTKFNIKYSSKSIPKTENYSKHSKSSVFIIHNEFRSVKCLCKTYTSHL